MTPPIDRRDFVKTTATAAAGAALVSSAGLAAASPANAGGLTSGFLFGQDDRVARLGVIGTGGRGRSVLRLLTHRADTEVPAICDTNSEAADLAQNMVEEAGRARPEAYTAGPEDYQNLLERDDLDGVIIATPWLWHTTMAVAAMKAGKYAGVEVPAATTVQECWDLVNTSEETGVPCMIMENVCYRRDVMAVLNMVQQGLFGELMHCHCGYQHDLRAVKFNPGAEFGEGARGEAVWRTEHAIHRNGELYPTHGVGPVARWLDIDRGNRFVTLTSHATKTRGLHEYIVAQGGEDHPNADVRFKLGDIVTTIIQCAKGETVIVSHDTNLPRPYSLNFRVQGTRGLWMVDNDSIYLEGISPEPHRWEPFGPYAERYDHPYWQAHAEDATGAGHGGMDWFVVNDFVTAVVRGEPTPIDVYAAAAWSVIGPLSERSIAMGNHPVEFPDFTRGRWTLP